MEYISGKILTIDGFKKGYIGYDKNKIIEIGKTIPPKKPRYKGLIIPTAINSHTHIGDTFIKNKIKKLPRDIEKLVGPPNGIKHKLLEKSSKKEILNGMKKSIDLMKKNGIEYFCDFREGGLEGIKLIDRSLENNNIKPLIFSRPKKLEYDKDEIEKILRKSKGIGISSISDWDYENLKKISILTKKKKKFFALHASERIREDINLIIDLKPDFLVHMIKANDNDLEIVSDNDIPIVLCPRSNFFYGLKPNYHMMKKNNIKILFGTDNAMINNTNIFDEIRFVLKNTNVFSIEELLMSITYIPRKVLNLSPCILGANQIKNFVVLNKKSIKPIYNATYNLEG